MYLHISHIASPAAVVRLPGEVVAEADLVADMELVVTQDVVNLAHGVLLVLVWAQAVRRRHRRDERSVRYTCEKRMANVTYMSM